jgi:hypothetical protein
MLRNSFLLLVFCDHSHECVITCVINSILCSDVDELADLEDLDLSEQGDEDVDEGDEYDDWE